MTIDERLDTILRELTKIKERQMLPLPQLMTADQVANVLQVSVGSVCNWVSQKKITYQKINGNVRFDRIKLQNWIDQRSVRTKIGGKVV